MRSIIFSISAVLICAGLLNCTNAYGSQTGAMRRVVNDKIGHPIPEKIVAELKKASREALDYTTPKTNNNRILHVAPAKWSGNGHKVKVLFMGAQFCPYCAAESWAIVLTLSRFGAYSHLSYMASSPKDVYPDTVAVSFLKSTYKSSTVKFVPVEVLDRQRHPLQHPTAEDHALFKKFDKPPYTQTLGGIPFVYVGGEYVIQKQMLEPSVIHGLGWRQVAKKLTNSHSAIFRAVMPKVNALTAAICKLDGQNPKAVCEAPAVIGERYQ